ncbi:MAG: ribbon-helix-helix protein, CopG family [Ilumatobacteraceae bacterium]
MRTTVTLDDDVAAAIDAMRRADGIGVSEAVNRLVRQTLVAPKRRTPYRHQSARVGLRVDVANVAEVLELLDAR